MTSDSREKMIRATVDLLRERGYSGTSLGDVLARSGGPRGSIYHHFPGGKDELVTEALRRYTASIERRIAAPGSAVDTVRALLSAMREGLRATDFSHGCAVAAVVLDASSAAVGSPAAEALASWRSVLAGALVRDGFSTQRAARLATLVIAAFEGAIILSRADRDTAPLDAVEAELVALLRP